MVEGDLAPYGGVTTLMKFNSTSAIVRAIAAGVGPALLSSLSVAGGIREGRLAAVPISGQGFRRTLRAVWQSGAIPRVEARELLAIAAGQSADSEAISSL